MELIKEKLPVIASLYFIISFRDVSFSRIKVPFFAEPSLIREDITSAESAFRYPELIFPSVSFHE
jgi:hypothetical protein